MRLIDADELMDILPEENVDARMAVLFAPTVDPPKELICSVNVDTDEIIERIKERGWRPVEHGRWEDCSNGWMCSVCKHDARKDYPYCPHCGAMMDEEG